MVMEVTPSPQCVGREFVRQYYTLLNQAPAHLHRFYSENSLFIHGGLDAPNRETKQVVGQEQIHEHIQQLNFRDCHAKIRQVDSQATLGNGVVVQVSGELSNGGQPMRRFTQTFVLAAQSPKKYYVHNDIFRYQDFLVDEEADLSRSDGEDDVECESSTEINQNGQGGDYYSGSAGSETINGASQLIEDTPPAFPPPPTVTQPVPEITQPAPPAPTPAPVVPVTQQFPTVKQVEESLPPVTQPPSPPADPTPPSPPKEDEWKWNEQTPVEAPRSPSPPPPPSNEPKTYANLLKGSHSHSTTSSYQKPLSPPPASLHNKSYEQTNSSSRDLPPTRNSLPLSSQPRGPRPGPGAPRGGMRDRPPQPRTSFSEDNDSEKSMGYRGGHGGPAPRHSSSQNGVHPNDNQQLFMGNIPLSAQEDELRALFGQFGTILDLKILSKVQKGPNNRVPNYGFIIFEDPATVQTVLQNTPIYFPNASDPTAVKLNVEEKKRRTPGPPDSRGPMDNRPRGGGVPMRGGRGGPRGGGMYRGDSGRGNMPPNSNSQGLRNSTSNSFNKPR
ncbi:hypothetical protein M8J75_004961 [Diaphorina citri]|nr:hypothetical protein M8J75_004961 [Diaphorina citri]